MSIDSESAFPVLHGQRITNTGDFKEVLVVVAADVAAGRITPKEANAINRDARNILKMFRAAISARKTAQV